MFSVTVISGGLSGETRPVGQVFKLGRNPGNDLSFSGIDSKTVSGFHAELIVDAGGIKVVDKNSTNGTFVNGERVDSAPAKHNDIISLGANGPKIRIMGQGAQAFSQPHPGSSLETPSQPAGSFLEEPTQAEAKGTSGIPLYPQHMSGDGGNYTMNLAGRLSEGQVDTGEMSSLIKNKARIERMEHSGMVSDRDLKMIKSASETFTKSRKKSYFIIGGISIVALIVVGILMVQNMGYRQKLKEQKRLLTNISELNSALDQEQANPQMDEGAKAELVAKLRAQERLLSKLRGKIASKDLAQMYKDPMGIEIHRAMESFGQSDYIVPDIFIQQVRKYIKSWQHGGRFVRAALRNKKYHAEMILEELRAANLPDAFLYLAMHESSLDSTIISRAGARGLWQFMPRTGRDYGLHVPANWRQLDSHEDERTHPRKATRSAIRYLKVLLGQFGTVPLAMAAYNAGEGRISRELRKIDDPLNNRDFWYIYRTGTLAHETNEYVPKIVATMVIDKNRGKYNF